MISFFKSFLLSGWLCMVAKVELDKFLVAWKLSVEFSVLGAEFQTGGDAVVI